jgi:hypothetical protein
MTPPSRRRIATVAERGRPAPTPSGKVEIAVGRSGSARSEGDSPGCWMAMNIVVASGVIVMPVISQPRGPT